MRRNQGKRYSKRRREKISVILLCATSILILICVGIILVLMVQSRGSDSQTMESHRNRENNNGSSVAMTYGNDLSRVDSEDVDTNSVAEDCGEWRLILVNANNPILDDFYPNLITLDNGQRIDERILEPLNAMMAVARSRGISLQVNSGFRSITEQQILFYNALDSWIMAGLSYEDARLQTIRYIAYPGTSEHHLGLAVDISEESSWAWLQENSAEFGFILRYPIGKEYITGVAHEPWHFRYVGVEVAIEITSRGITLEEFLRDR